MPIAGNAATRVRPDFDGSPVRKETIRWPAVQPARPPIDDTAPAGDALNARAKAMTPGV